VKVKWMPKMNRHEDYDGQCPYKKEDEDSALIQTIHGKGDW